jgi:2-polyprenyl-3-methyl-5-hydroxy-6-metoxy-1,4-benzoquinol methylase
MSPVNGLPPNSKGFHDVFGNAWEWTEDYFCPLPGFSVHPYYEDFSTPCFDGLHQVIQGGSFMSTGDEASVHARFHFRPHFYQHASCRLVEQNDSTTKDLFTSDTDAPGPYVGSYPFRRSTESVLAMNKSSAGMSAEDSEHITNPNVLLSKHFGRLSFAPLWGMEGFFSTLREHIRFAESSTKSLQNAKVIEIGCGAGGLSFALANSCASVIGIDHSMESISIAKQLQIEGKLPYSLPNEGNTVSTHLATRPEAEGKMTKLDFRCADPMCIPAEMHGFDVVVLNDVLDKISSPNAVLGRLGGVRGLVSSGGCLVAISAYQWNENRTPKSLWLGGQEATAQSSEEELIARMAQEDFVVYQRMQVPLLWHSNAKEVKGKVFNVTFFYRK